MKYIKTFYIGYYNQQLYVRPMYLFNEIDVYIT